MYFGSKQRLSDTVFDTNNLVVKSDGAFLMLFNRDGYVMDFTTNDFDVFFTNSIGIAL